MLTFLDRSSDPKTRFWADMRQHVQSKRRPDAFDDKKPNSMKQKAKMRQSLFVPGSHAHELASGETKRSLGLPAKPVTQLQIDLAVMTRDAKEEQLQDRYRRDKSTPTHVLMQAPASHRGSPKRRPGSHRHKHRSPQSSARKDGGSARKGGAGAGGGDAGGSASEPEPPRSPTGRFHADTKRRTELRHLDIVSFIDYARGQTGRGMKDNSYFMSQVCRVLLHGAGDGAQMKHELDQDPPCSCRGVC